MSNDCFFVYIIESPSADDFYDGRSEGSLLQQVIHLHGIPCINRVAISGQIFHASMQTGLAAALGIFPSLTPVIHISAHGNSQGIQLANGEVISWDALKNLLTPVNKNLGNRLLLCMSSCEGLAACKMAMSLEPGDHPFFSIIGPINKPSWPDAAVAFTTLYHQLAKGASIPEAIEAMKIASGERGFTYKTAKETQQGYIGYCRQKDTEELLERLRQQLSTPIGSSSYQGWGAAYDQYGKPSAIPSGSWTTLPKK